MKAKLGCATSRLRLNLCHKNDTGKEYAAKNSGINMKDGKEQKKQL